MARVLLSILPPIIGFLLLLILPTSAQNNILFSGETLGTDQQLSYAGSNFIMQGDCNLVLYGVGGFQSDTSGRGANCKLTLTNKGQFIIKNSKGNTVWTSSPASNTEGKYVAVVRPDGTVAIYGPQVWSTPARYADDVVLQALGNTPMVENVLFSGQILYGATTLKSRDYTLRLDSCNLILLKGSTTVWETKTTGSKCFVRLNYRGQLSVVTDYYDVVFRSGDAKPYVDEYVLVLQLNGQAAIYGPTVWSAGKPKSGGVMISSE